MHFLYFEDVNSHSYLFYMCRYTYGSKYSIHTDIQQMKLRAYTCDHCKFGTEEEFTRIPDVEVGRSG